LITPFVDVLSGPWGQLLAARRPRVWAGRCEPALDTISANVYTWACGPGRGPPCPGACWIVRVGPRIAALPGRLQVLSYQSAVAWPVPIPASAFHIAPVRQLVRCTTALDLPLDDVPVSEEADTHLRGGDRIARLPEALGVVHSTSHLAVA
jgi:hypothetical protein